MASPLPDPAEDREPRDARTTPPWARVPVLLALLALLAYEATAYRYALYDGRREDVPGWLLRNPYALWPATWQMFTLLDKRHNQIDAQVLREGEWVDIDLEAHFPFRWESGPRYARSSFRQSATRMRTLAQATCRRVDPRPQAVRFLHTRWGKTLGSAEQPREGARTKTILEWDCDDTFRLPRGERI